MLLRYSVMTSRGAYLRLRRQPSQPAQQRNDTVGHGSRPGAGPTAVSRPTSIISRSNVPELSNSIIQKGLTLARDWSGTVVHSGIKDA